MIASPFTKEQLKKALEQFVLNPAPQILVAGKAYKYSTVKEWVRKGHVDGVANVNDLIHEIQGGATQNDYRHDKQPEAPALDLVKDAMEMVLRNSDIEAFNRKSYSRLFPNDGVVNIGEFETTWGQVKENFSNGVYAAQKTPFNACVDDLVKRLAAENGPRLIYAQILIDALYDYYNEHGKLPKKEKLVEMVNANSRSEVLDEEKISYDDIMRAFEDPFGLLIGWHHVMYAQAGKSVRKMETKERGLVKKFKKGLLDPPSSLKDLLFVYHCKLQCWAEDNDFVEDGPDDLELSH